MSVFMTSLLGVRVVLTVRTRFSWQAGTVVRGPLSSEPRSTSFDVCTADAGLA